MKFKKKVQIRPAFDKRDPNPSKNYGIHGADMLFTLIGEKAAVTFMLYTNWHLPHIVEEFEHLSDHTFCRPLPADIGYHSPYAMYEGQRPRKKACEYIGVPCYQDGSASYADEFYQELITKGSKGLWAKMKEYYKSRFENKDIE
jgi:hypothetical protein